MTRTIYLIRHAMPDIPLGERWCIGGLTDLPLSRLGRIQAARLPFVPKLRAVEKVFASPLLRAKETALPLGKNVKTVPGLEEQRMGCWDGLPFREITARWPSLYEAREKNPSLLPEGAEPDGEVERRMRAALARCLKMSTGDIAAVSHKSAIASLTGGRSSLAYTSISVLTETDGELSVQEVGVPVLPALTDALCLAMLRAAGADEKLTAHCMAVAAEADRLCAALQRAGLSVDAEAVHFAALLHDLAKGEKEHAAVGGLWMKELGYPELAEIVRQHTEPDSDALNEAGLVFLADKLVRGSERVNLEARFAASMEKCRTEEARAAHDRRLALALSLREQLRRLCGAEII